MTQTFNKTDSYLIYAGGTFGCHGTPLSPLPAAVFLPTLQHLLGKSNETCHCLSNALIKDSSALTPSDFVHFYSLIAHAYQHGARRFVLITGTDSLSFLSAFLFHAFGGWQDLSLVITGSMQPLLIADNPDYTLNPHSDAWENLLGSINITKHRQGIFVYFTKKLLWANNTQKAHSHHADAFTGDSGDTPCPAPTWQSGGFVELQQQAKTAHIHTLYLLPNHPEQIALQLSQLSHSDIKAVILIAFGAGNFSQTQAIKDALDTLHRQNIAVVCTSMCAFGGVSLTYMAGAWQYQHHVWSGKTLSIAGIYGKLLWLSLNNQLNAANWNQD